MHACVCMHIFGWSDFRCSIFFSLLSRLLIIKALQSPAAATAAIILDCYPLPDRLLARIFRYTQRAARACVSILNSLLSNFYCVILKSASKSTRINRLSSAFGFFNCVHAIFYIFFLLLLPSSSTYIIFHIQARRRKKYLNDIRSYFFFHFIFYILWVCTI